MTYIAMYIGGPKDGTREEHLDPVREIIGVIEMRGPSLLRVGSVENDMNPIPRSEQVFIYRRHRMRGDVSIPVEVYAPENWTPKDIVTRLLEYYRPEQDEQR